VELEDADGPLADGGADPRPRAAEIPPESEALRHAMTRLSAGVCVVTASWQGRLHAMTATAVCSVSLDPPLVLVCVGRASRFHAAVVGASRWGVSVLAEDQADLARHFADRGRDLLTQFDTVPHHRGGPGWSARPGTSTTVATTRSSSAVSWTVPAAPAAR
jgi:flavin reductase (DIM6/NTAB) family NADH-FMN oxidoreductase RutF